MAWNLERLERIYGTEVSAKDGPMVNNSLMIVFRRGRCRQLPDIRGRSCGFCPPGCFMGIAEQYCRGLFKCETTSLA
jgi:hypothetical protein